MSTESAVDAWFSERQHPLKPIMLRVREIILRPDRRISEVVKYLRFADIRTSMLGKRNSRRSRERGAT